MHLSRVLDIISTGVCCDLGLSFFAFAAFRFSDEVVPGTATPMITPLKAMLPATTVRKKKEKKTMMMMMVMVNSNTSHD